MQTDHGDHSESLQLGVLSDVAAAVARAVSVADGMAPELGAEVPEAREGLAFVVDSLLSRRASVVGIVPIRAKANATVARRTAVADAAERIGRRRCDETNVGRRIRIAVKRSIVCYLFSGVQGDRCVNLGGLKRVMCASAKITSPASFLVTVLLVLQLKKRVVHLSACVPSPSFRQSPSFI